MGSKISKRLRDPDPEMAPYPSNRARVGYAEEKLLEPGRQPKKKGEEGRPRSWREAKKITRKSEKEWQDLMDEWTLPFERVLNRPFYYLGDDDE